MRCQRRAAMHWPTGGTCVCQLNCQHSSLWLMDGAHQWGLRCILHEPWGLRDTAPYRPHRGWVPVLPWLMYITQHVYPRPEPRTLTCVLYFLLAYTRFWLFHDFHQAMVSLVHTPSPVTGSYRTRTRWPRCGRADDGPHFCSGLVDGSWCGSLLHPSFKDMLLPVQYPYVLHRDLEPLPSSVGVSTPLMVFYDRPESTTYLEDEGRRLPTSTRPE